MSGTLKGFLITLGVWALLAGGYALIELLRGNVPFALFEWNAGGRFIIFTVLLVLALGTGIGRASDKIRSGR